MGSRDNLKAMIYDLESRLEQRSKEFTVLECENLLFKNFLARQEQSQRQMVEKQFPAEAEPAEDDDLHRIMSTVSSAHVSVSRIETTPSTSESPKRRKHEKSRKLTRLQKQYMLKLEMKSLQEAKEKLLRERDQRVAILSFRIEECQMTLEEVQRSLDHFVKLAKSEIDPRSNTVRAEKLSNYFADCLRLKGTLIENLRMKGYTYAARRKAIFQNIDNKLELCDDFEEMDMTKLEINTRSCQMKMEDQNQRLGKLKVLNGRSTAACNFLKENIVKNQALLDQIARETAWQTKFLCSLSLNVERQRVAAARSQRILEQIDSWTGQDVPAVADFIALQHVVDKLRRTVQRWQMKVGYAQRVSRVARKTKS